MGVKKQRTVFLTFFNAHLSAALPPTLPNPEENRTKIMKKYVTKRGLQIAFVPMNYWLNAFAQPN